MANKISKTQQDTLLDEVQDHYEEADKFLETRREDWDDLEAMLIGSLTDDLSHTTQNSIFDPILSTIVYERVSRVMAQNPKGKAYAGSADDIGKNALMNLLLKYNYKNANEQDSMLIKLRMMDLYSLVYGSMFGLVPWRAKRDDYVGPDFNILPLRDSFPQPTKRNVKDMDWFIVRNVVSIDWLKEQDSEMWINIDALESSLKEKKDGGDTSRSSDDDKKSFVEKKYYPSTTSDVVFPQVEILTEYRKDKWVTYAPQQVNSKTSKPFILRVGRDPYVEGMLPIVAKHAFPLIDSPIGWGEFARGKSLQMGINSLWNLYLTGVKYSIFPPIHINPDNVTPSTIKWGEGEFWFMQQPNIDVQPMKMSPEGINTFHSTFGAMKAAIESQAGTTSVRESTSSQSSIGKTPEAIKFISEKESSRDEWDRVMMEDTITSIFERWIALNVNKMEKEVQMRLFKEEIEDIQSVYPDVVEMFDSGRGKVTIKKDNIDDTYDFVLEVGSTAKPDLEAEQTNLTTILKAVLENPPILEALKMKGKMVDIAELFKMWLSAGSRKDIDKIIVDLPKQQPVEGTPPMGMPQVPMGVPAGVPPEMTGQPPMGTPMPQEMVQPEVQFQDPMIQKAYLEFIGGVPQQ